MYKYYPILLDRLTPMVLKGGLIQSGASVDIFKIEVDPTRKFRYVRDIEGNEMSVDVKSLKREY